MDVVAAYEILGDPDKRAAFDDMGGKDQASPIPPPTPPLAFAPFHIAPNRPTATGQPARSPHGVRTLSARTIKG